MNYVDCVGTEETLSSLSPQNTNFDIILKLRLLLLVHFVIEHPHKLFFILLVSEFDVAVSLIVRQLNHILVIFVIHQLTSENKINERRLFPQLGNKNHTILEEH